MSADNRLDADDFQREFQARVSRSRKSLSEIVNWAAFRILRRMITSIPRADRAEIEKLGIAGYEIARPRGKSGKLHRLKKPRPIYHPSTRFRAIFAAQLRKKGINPRTLGKGVFDTMANAAFKRRLSSVGYVAAGWIKPLRMMVRALGGAVSAGETPPNFRGSVSGGEAAKYNDWSPGAEFYNANGMSNPNNSAASKSRVVRILETSIERAFAEETAEMQAHAEKKIGDALEGR